MQSRGKKAALWAIVLLWVLFVIESLTAGYFLLFAPTYYRPVYLEKPNDQHLWRTEYHDWGAWRKPSSTATHTHKCFAVTYRSNSYGARDRERSVTTSTKRAVMLGDSFVEGHGVDEDKRLSNLLESDLRIEVLNFGTGDLGPLQYQILYEKFVRKFDHHAVLVGFLPQNDFTDNDLDFSRKKRAFASRYIPYYGANGEVFYPTSRPDPASPYPARERDVRNNPENRSVAQNLMRLFWVFGLYRDIRYTATVLSHPTPSSYVGYFESDAVRVSRAIGSLVAIKELAAPRPVLVMFFPDYRSWSYIAAHPDAYARSTVVRMRAELESRGLRTVDLLEHWMDRGLDRDQLYLPCDGHWNEVGQQAALETVRPFVKDALQHAPLIRSAPVSQVGGSQHCSTAPYSPGQTAPCCTGRSLKGLTEQKLGHYPIDRACP